MPEESAEISEKQVVDDVAPAAETKVDEAFIDDFDAAFDGDYGQETTAEKVAVPVATPEVTPVAAPEAACTKVAEPAQVANTKAPEEVVAETPKPAAETNEAKNLPADLSTS